MIPAMINPMSEGIFSLYSSKITAAEAMKMTSSDFKNSYSVDIMIRSGKAGETDKSYPQVLSQEPARFVPDCIHSVDECR
jgi:hypothetical protein